MENNFAFPPQKHSSSAQATYSEFYLVLFLIILLLPLLVLPPWFIPIGWGKTIVFRIILSILLIFFSWQVLFRQADLTTIVKKLRSSPLILSIISALFGVYLLSTIFSPNPQFSLWGDPLRSGGVVNFAFYLIFAILAFLTIKKEDWQKVWDFSILVGILVSLIAIFQQFSIYSKFLVPFTFRPIGTIGSPISLSLYLLLLTFLALSFFIRSRSLVRRVFYLVSLLLFIFVSVILTQARSAILGLAIGFLWFLFAYPKKLTKLKIFVVIILGLTILGMFYLNSHFYILDNQPYLIRSAIGRILSMLEVMRIAESRISVWQVSWQALTEKPILGWGPENFKIAFDKYYDSSLPQIGWRPDEEVFYWWDRAHNFIFDIAIPSGVPALLIYLLLFGILWWKLQQLKKRRPENTIIMHGIQATIIGYFLTNLFIFDIFDTYLLLFLLLGYALHLIYEASELKNNLGEIGSVTQKIYPHRTIVMSSLFFILFWFIFSFNIKPLQAVKDLNLAFDYERGNRCDKALKIIYRITSTKNIADSYIATSSIRVIRHCISRHEESAQGLTEKAVQILRINAQNNPQYTLNWVLLGEHINLLIEERKKLAQEGTPFSQEELEKLKQEGNAAFEKAAFLSPKRQEVYLGWAKINIATEDFERAKKNSQKCIDLNPAYGGCYWLMALTQGYLGDSEKFNSYSQLAKEKSYDIDIRSYGTEGKEALQSLVNLYFKTGNLSGLADTYLKLIEITKDNKEKAQLLGSLASVYKELGQIDKARETALQILEILPEAKPDVDAFLQILPK